jgi:hypothetical protein
MKFPAHKKLSLPLNPREEALDQPGISHIAEARIYLA